MCWHERVTGSRVRQLQPRLLEQRFSVRRFVYPAISPPILESLRSSLLSFFSFLFFLLSGPTTKFLHTLGAHVSRPIARNSSFCVIFNFCLFENHGMGMKFEVLLRPPEIAKDAWRDPRYPSPRHPTAFYISHPPRITVKITGREHAFRGGYVDRYDPPRASLFPCPDLIEETRCRERCCLNVLLHFFLSLFFPLPPYVLFFHSSYPRQLDRPSKKRPNIVYFSRCDSAATFFLFSFFYNDRHTRRAKPFEY